MERTVGGSKSGPDPETEDRVMLLQSRKSRIYFLRRFFDYPLTLTTDTVRAKRSDGRDVGIDLKARGFVNRTLLWLIVAAALLIAIVLYISRPGTKLNVDPHSREVIEKAKRR
jgi:hypothetical protein